MCNKLEKNDFTTWKIGRCLSQLKKSMYLIGLTVWSQHWLRDTSPGFSLQTWNLSSKSDKHINCRFEPTHVSYRHGWIPNFTDHCLLYFDPLCTKECFCSFLYKQKQLLRFVVKKCACIVRLRCFMMKFSRRIPFSKKIHISANQQKCLDICTLPISVPIAPHHCY